MKMIYRKFPKTPSLPVTASYARNFVVLMQWSTPFVVGCWARGFLLNPLYLTQANEQNINWRTNIFRLVRYLHFNEPSGGVDKACVPDFRVIIYISIKGVVFSYCN